MCSFTYLCRMNLCQQIKRMVYVGGLVITLLILSGCASQKDYKSDIFQLVNENTKIILEDIAENDFSDSLELPDIASVKQSKNCYVFDCGGYGNSASSHEFGFYYSVQDLPVGVWGDAEFCQADDFTIDGAGFSSFFYENPYYTEKICDYFYYYEIHF